MASRPLAEPIQPNDRDQIQLPQVSHVVLKVYDILGREVATLVNEVQDAGYESVLWDASPVNGASGCASGVYFYRLEAGGFVDVKELVLLR